MDGRESGRMDDFLPSPSAFATVLSASVQDLVSITLQDLNSILPSLVRTATCVPLDTSEHFAAFRREVQKKVAGIDAVNVIVSLLRIDFNVVHEDAVKEQHLRKKLGGITLTDTITESLHKGLLLEFEENNSLQKMRLVLSEILRIASLVKESKGKFNLDETDLFACKAYLPDICNVVCVAFSELPFLLPICEVTEALLRVQYGPWILCRMVANNPDCFDVVCSSILGHASSSDESMLETQIRTKTLKMLCKMNPQYSKLLRAECVSLKKLAGLALELSINHSEKNNVDSDIVIFLTGLLLASDGQTKNWIEQYIRLAQKEHKENALNTFKIQLIKEMKAVIHSIQIEANKEEAMNTDSTFNHDLNNNLMHGISIMRLFCVLKTMSNFKLTTEESEFLVDLITSQPPATPVGVRYVVVALCTLVACTFLLSSEQREQKVIEWLKALVRKSSVYEKETGMNESYGETLLLIVIHFHGHSLEPVVELVCSTLGIKLRPTQLTKLKILFTQEVFPEKVVAEHALTVPVTTNLNRFMKVFLPVHCLHQLLKSRVFSKHCISVKDWLFEQICSCGSPVHPLMVPLIETYIHSIITPLNISKTKHQRMSSLQPFSEEKLAAVFSGNIECCDIKTSKLLFMFYALMYQDSLLNTMETLSNNPHAPREYSTLLYSLIPMKELLLYTRNEERLFGDLYPPLLRLLIVHYPHLCLVEDSIVEEEIQEGEVLSHSKLDVRNKLSLETIFVDVHSSHMSAIACLSKLAILQPTELVQHIDTIIQLLPEILDPKVPRKIQILCAKVWAKLNTAAPRCLWLKTVNVLRKQPDYVTHDWEKNPEYSEEEIKKDPLIVLRCNPNVYRCPPVFDIILRVLNGYLTASRSLLNHHLLSNPVIPGSKPQQEIKSIEQEREDLKIALIAAQESGALQILLEVCLSTDYEKESLGYSVRSQLHEIQCKVCCFIHQSFILQPGIAKLLHFQGYPPELLHITIAGVPSMHICIDFIPELLNQPHLEKQLFAVQLMSHLAVQYPIEKSFSMCKYVMNRIKSLLAGLPASKRNQFFVPALETLVRFCKAFPPLRTDITEFLLKVSKVASSQLSKTSSTVLPSLRVQSGSDDVDLMDEEKEFDLEIINNDAGRSQACDEIKVSKTFCEHLQFSQSVYMKPCSSKELLDETDKIYQEIVNMSLAEKLSLLDSNSSIDGSS